MDVNKSGHTVFLFGLCDFKSQLREIWKICHQLYQKLNWDLTHAIFQVPPRIFKYLPIGDAVKTTLFFVLGAHPGPEVAHHNHRVGTSAFFQHLRV